MVKNTSKISNKFSKRTDLPVFRERLLEALNRSGLSQRKLALELGKDPRSINHIFSGEVKAPDLHTLKDLSSKLDVSMDWLIGNKNEDITSEKAEKHVVRYFSHKKKLLDEKSCTAESYLPMNRFPLFDKPTTLDTCPVSTDLYEPYLYSADVVFIDRTINKVRYPSFYITHWEEFNEVYVEHLSYLNNGVFHTYPEGSRGNKSQKDKVEVSLEKIQILGKVIGKYSSHII